MRNQDDLAESDHVGVPAGALGCPRPAENHAVPSAAVPATPPWPAL